MCFVSHRLYNYILWMSHSLGIQIAIGNCTQYHRERVHSTIHGQQGTFAMPLRHLVKELQKQGLLSTPLDSPFSTTKTSTLKATTIYKDNASCIVLAHSEGTKVRTKHISLKWHHFKDHIKNGDLKVVKIESSLDRADILTKPLCKVKHESVRKFIMVW
jgi:hypothetical protein